MTDMKKIRNVLSMFVIAAILLAQTGCALITTRKVAMAVGKAVGKKVIEKKIEDNQAKKEIGRAHV